MKNFSTLVAGIGLATTMALAFQSSAQAYDFSFENFTTGKHSASGIFRIDDNTPQGAITKADFLDWKITIEDGRGGAFSDNILYGPGGAFGTPNSNNTTSYVGSAVFDSSELRFTDTFDFRHNDGFIGGRIAQFGLSSVSVVANDDYSSGSVDPGFLVASRDFSTTATPVPFSEKTNLSILILGGLYGASRLRKTLAARSK